MQTLEKCQFIEYGVAARPLPGEEISGDSYIVIPGLNSVLIAVIDGSGHGEEAALAASRAVGVIQEHHGESLQTLFKLCHGKLKETHGAAMTLAALNHSDAILSWGGVGNVEAVLLQKQDSDMRKERVLLRNGVIGYRFTEPRISNHPIYENDVLIFATDGIHTNFVDQVDSDGPAQKIADSILERYVNSIDDALVLVVRYLRGAL